MLLYLMTMGPLTFISASMSVDEEMTKEYYYNNLTVN